MGVGHRLSLNGRGFFSCLPLPFSFFVIDEIDGFFLGGEIDNPHTRTKRSLSSGGKGVNQTEKVPFSNRSAELNETLCTPPSKLPLCNL